MSNTSNLNTVQAPKVLDTGNSEISLKKQWVITKSKTQFWTQVKVFVGGNLPEHFHVIYVKEEEKKFRKKSQKEKVFRFFPKGFPFRCFSHMAHSSTFSNQQTCFP
jgi:hypothetical protein